MSNILVYQFCDFFGVDCAILLHFSNSNLYDFLLKNWLVFKPKQISWTILTELLIFATIGSISYQLSPDVLHMKPKRNTHGCHLRYNANWLFGNRSPTMPLKKHHSNTILSTYHQWKEKQKGLCSTAYQDLGYDTVFRVTFEQASQYILLLRCYFELYMLHPNVPGLYWCIVRWFYLRNTSSEVVHFLE